MEKPTAAPHFSFHTVRVSRHTPQPPTQFRSQTNDNVFNSGASLGYSCLKVFISMSLSDISSKNLGVELSPTWQDKKVTGRRGLPLDAWLPLRLAPAVRMKSRRISALEDSRVVSLETACGSRLVTEPPWMPTQFRGTGLQGLQQSKTTAL